MSQPRAERPTNIPYILGLVTFFHFFLEILFCVYYFIHFLFIVLLSSLVSLCSYFIGKSSLSRVPLESGCIATPDSLVGLVRLLGYTCIVYLCLGFLFFGGDIASLLIPCSLLLFLVLSVFFFFFDPWFFPFQLPDSRDFTSGLRLGVLASAVHSYVGSLPRDIWALPIVVLRNPVALRDYF